MLAIYGFYHVWLQHSVGNPKLFLQAVKQRIHDVDVQVLNDTISNSTRALFYRTISQFEFSLYLDVIQVKNYRTAMSRLRLSSHRLAVESGRWHKPLPIPFIERKCTICNVLQDEFHIVIECNLFKDLRNRYISRYVWLHPNYFKFTQLLATHNEAAIKKLSIFVFKAFEKLDTFNRIF